MEGLGKCEEKSGEMCWGVGKGVKMWESGERYGGRCERLYGVRMRKCGEV